MGMDEQYLAMRRFKDDLVRFNAQLQDTMHDLIAKHEYVDPMWHDEMRRTYDIYWQPLDQQMNHYLEREGVMYEDFLARKIRALEGYLYGR